MPAPLTLPANFDAFLDQAFGFIGFDAPDLDHEPITRTAAVQAARNYLRRHGWTQAEAARELGVSTVHLCYVLTDRRISNRLLRDIQALPENPIPA